MADPMPWEEYSARRPSKPARPAAPAPWEENWTDKRGSGRAAAPSAGDAGTATGEVHDGDTFRLSSGVNARLYGADAFELAQSGRGRSGALVPLGKQARGALASFATASGVVTPTGALTYGRPVASLDNGGDAATALLREGLAVATPEYLRTDPERLGDYMEAERGARLNRRGAWQTQFEQPASFRNGTPDPWATAEVSPDGKGVGVFWDEPLPAQGLRPEIERGYSAIFEDLASKPDDLLAYAKANGFEIDAGETRQRYAARDKAGRAGGEVTYATKPRVLTNSKDGAFGAAVRGLADPVNILDEVGALANTLVPGSDRENVWSSDRRFGDVYANNLDQNRSVLDFDDSKHPIARFGGQLAGGVLLPGASLRGVGFGAARAALRGGGTRFAAEQAGRGAVTRRLGIAGAVEGTAAGVGQGETWQDRVGGGLIGGVAGTALGLGTGLVAPKVADLVSSRFGRQNGRRPAPGQDRATKPAGRFGPIHADLVDDYPAALATMRAEGTGEVPGAINHPELGPVDLVWGDSRYGLMHISAKHPEVIDDLPAIVARLPIKQTPEQVGNNRFVLEDAQHRAVIAPDFDGETKRWVVTAYERKGSTPGDQTSRRDPLMPDGGSTGSGAAPDIRFGSAPRNASPEQPDDPADAGTALQGTDVSLRLGRAGLTPGRPGGLTGDEYVGRFAKPASVKEYVSQPAGSSRLGSAVIGPDGTVHMFRTNGSELGHADEVGHYDFGYAVGPDVDSGFAAVTRYNGEIALTRPVTATPRQQRALNELVARARREGLNIVDEEPKPLPSDAARREFADMQAEYARLHAPPQPAAAMDAGSEGAVLEGPWDDYARPVEADLPADGPWTEFAGPAVNRIDVNAGPRLLLRDATDYERFQAAERIAPEDVLPLPSNTVGSLEEAERIAAGRFASVRAPNEADTLGRRNIPSPRDATRTMPKRGPLDLVTWLRTQGGVRAQSGELEHYGIDNRPRKGMDFAGGEARFGPLVSSDGMNYDDAAMRAWEAGFFPDHVDRPTVDEFLDALGGTHSGRDRAFRPDDLGEVEAFEKARSQRWDVESARERGAPMVEDRGQPIGLDDLEANAPPVRAYEEWGENAPDFAGNLRLDKLDSPQAIKRALVAAHQRVGGFDAATRGRITQAETANLASDLGMTADDLLKRRKGQAFNAEEALAARQIVARSATDLVNLAKRMQRADNPGDDLEKAFAAAWLRHVAIQEQVAGVTAEAGRVLAQFRMAASSGATNRVLPSFDMVTGGPSRLKDAARLIVDTAADPAAVNANAARLLKPRFRDKLVELYYNSLLSGPQTHAVNVLSNVITSVTQIPEHLAAAGVGVVRQAAGRQRANPDRVLFAEVGARAVGLLQGTREGMREAARTFRTGDPSDAISKVEGMSQRAISGVKGSIIRTPSRALSAEDELFKAMARRMELTGLAVRQATTEGLRGEAGKARIAELVANPPDAMLGRSLDYARYLTFQTPLEHGSISQSISLFAQKHPLVKLLVPFVRTPVNILKYAGERSPAAPLLKDWRAQFRAGGADRDLAVAKMMVGSGLMASVASFAGEGSMTGGGPADESAKRLLRADGWQPYSFRVGDKFYSYQRLDPLATTLGVAADFAELQSHMTVKQREHVAMMLTSATIKNLSNKVWFSGVTDLSNAITDSQRYGGGFLRRMAGSLTVPTGVAQVARTIDPTLRETRTFLDAVRARIPVASKSLFPRRDVWGRPVEREGGLGPDLVSPVWTGTARNDPVNSELLAAGARIGALQRRDYTPEQFDRYQEVAGSLAYTGMQSLIGSGEWTGASLPDRADMAETVVRDARREAREVVGASVGGSDPWTEFQDAR